MTCKSQQVTSFADASGAGSPGSGSLATAPFNGSTDATNLAALTALHSATPSGGGPFLVFLTFTLFR